MSGAAHLRLPYDLTSWRGQLTLYVFTLTDKKSAVFSVPLDTTGTTVSSNVFGTLVPNFSQIGR